MHISKVLKKKARQPKTTTKITSTSTARKAHRNFSTLDTQLVENAINSTALLETTHINILVSTLSLYMCIYLRWKNGARWRKTKQLARAHSDIPCIYFVFLYFVQYSRSIFFNQSTEKRALREGK
jgi:hypothetical protein